MTQPPHELDYGTQPRRRRWWVWCAFFVGTSLALVVSRDVLLDLHTDWRVGKRTAEDYRVALLSVPLAGSLVYGEFDDRAHVYDAHVDPAAPDTRTGWYGREAFTLRGRAGVHGFKGYPPWWGWGTLLYLGERHSSFGHPRLIYVELYSALQPAWRYDVDPQAPIYLWTLAIDQFDWRGRPRSDVGHGEAQLAKWPDPRERRTRFYFGAADSEDASRFSIRYEVGNDEDGFEEGFIDGKLEDDLTVTLTVRDGPLLGQ